MTVAFIMAEDLERLQARFDRHLEIYAQNGKELAALKTEVRVSHKALQDALTALTAEIRKQSSDHVSRAEFWPVKLGFYGFYGLMGTAVVGALLALVVV